MGQFEMNYIEVGLPHSEFVPTRKEFTPRRRVPISGLGKRYLGLETMKQSEVNYLVMRLSQPKKSQVEEDMGTETTNAKTAKRFIGRKKMSGTDIKSMVERLSKGRSEKSQDTKRVQSAQEKRQRKNTTWQENNTSRKSI